MHMNLMYVNLNFSNELLSGLAIAELPLSVSESLLMEANFWVSGGL